MPRVKQFNENEVLERAMNLFWQKGYHGTSMQDLVNHLGINRASLYDTYGSKNALFSKAFELYRSTNTQKFKQFLNSQPDVKTGLFKLFQYTLQESIQDKHKKGCFVVNTTTELASADKKIQKILRANQENYVNLFHQYLLEAEKKGEITKGKDLYAIAHLLFTYYNGLKVITKLDPKSDEILSSVKAVLSLLD